MNRLRIWAEAQPARAAWWIVGVFFAVSALPPFLFPVDVDAVLTDFLTLDRLPTALRWQFGYVLIAVAAIAVFGWLRQAGLRGNADAAGLRFSGWVIIPVLVVYVLVASVAPGIAPGISPQVLQLVLLLNVGVALLEETLFRGALFHGLRTDGTLFRAVVLSSVVFGLFHGINYLYGQDGLATLYQILFATCIGVLFCGLRLQSNSLWPPIVLHAFWNSYIMTAILVSEDQFGPVEPGEALQGSWASVVLPLAFLWIGIVAIRRWVRRTT